MRYLSLLIWFFITTTFAQSQKIKVQFDSIFIAETSKNYVEYHFNYQIKNTTNDTLSFFLLPNAIIAHAASSLTLYPVYKIYQSGVFEDMDGPFFEYETDDELAIAKQSDKDSEEAQKLIKNYQKNHLKKAQEILKNYQDNHGESTDFGWIYYRQQLLDNKQIVLPNQTKSFTIKTIWDKKRFIKNDDLEFYLDSKNTIEIELILDLKTNSFKDKLSEKDLEEITKNSNFISGTFVSNKLKIEFPD